MLHVPSQNVIHRMYRRDCNVESISAIGGAWHNLILHQKLGKIANLRRQLRAIAYALTSCLEDR